MNPFIPIMRKRKQLEMESIPWLKGPLGKKSKGPKSRWLKLPKAKVVLKASLWRHEASIYSTSKLRPLLASLIPKKRHLSHGSMMLFAWDPGLSRSMFSNWARGEVGASIIVFRLGIPEEETLESRLSGNGVWGLLLLLLPLGLRSSAACFSSSMQGIA